MSLSTAKAYPLLMIHVTDTICIDENEIQFDFVRASGPGGQNVNKVATAAQLRFDAGQSPALPEEVRARLMRLAGKRLSVEGVLIIDARRYRTQEQNRVDAIERLSVLIRAAAEPPKPRHPTRPTRASKVRHAEQKQQRSVLKRNRRAVQADNE